MATRERIIRTVTNEKANYWNGNERANNHDITEAVSNQNSDARAKDWNSNEGGIIGMVTEAINWNGNKKENY